MHQDRVMYRGINMKVTIQQAEEAKTERGGFRFDQIKLAYAFMGRDWKGQPEEGWLQEFISADLPESVWQKFCQLKQPL